MEINMTTERISEIRKWVAHFLKGGLKSFIHEGVGSVIGNNTKWGAGIMALGRHYHPSKGQGSEEVQNQVRSVTRQELRKSLSHCQAWRVGARRMQSSGPVPSCPPILCWCLCLAKFNGKSKGRRGGPEGGCQWGSVDLALFPEGRSGRATGDFHSEIHTLVISSEPCFILNSLQNYVASFPSSAFTSAFFLFRMKPIDH